MDGLVDFRKKSLLLKSTNDARLVRCLSLAGARCQLLVTEDSVDPVGQLYL